MSDFTFIELLAAHKALSSSYRKIEKVRETLLEKQPPPKSQLTLATRNQNALRIALALLTEEIEKSKINDSMQKPESQDDSQRLAAFEGTHNEQTNNNLV